MLAKYDGYCIDCDQNFEVGEEIVKRDGSWVHASCPLVMPLTRYCNECYTYASVDDSCLCD